MEIEGLNNVQAIKKFFETGKNGRSVTMTEMKALSKDEREAMGADCRKALGVR